MKEEILTAKEWLEKEEIYNSYIDHSKQGEEIGLIRFSEIMEKYANYKNKVLEDRIKEFRDKLTEVQFNMFLKDQENKIWIIEEKSMLALIFMEYDKHFNIQNNIKE